MLNIHSNFSLIEYIESNVEYTNILVPWPKFLAHGSQLAAHHSFNKVPLIRSLFRSSSIFFNDVPSMASKVGYFNIKKNSGYGK